MVEIIVHLGIWRVTLLSVLLVSIPWLALIWYQEWQIETLTYQINVLLTSVYVWREGAINEQSEWRFQTMRYRKEMEQEQRKARQTIQAVERDHREWRRRAARETNIRNPLSREMRLTVFTRDGFRCRSCGYQAHDSRGRRLHVDHIVPVALGGTNNLDNLQTLCDLCNIKKSDKLPDEFKTALQGEK